MIELDELEQRIMQAYTEKRPCVMDGYPDAHTAWLRSGVQQFCVTPDGCESAADANWYQAMLAKALARIVRDVS